MTDKCSALIVVLEHDMREERVAPLIEAIKQLKGVLSVSEHASDIDSYIGEERARVFLLREIYNLLGPTGEKR